MFKIKKLDNPCLIPQSAKLVAIETNDPTNREILRIEWFLSMNCNLSCSYCVEYNNKTNYMPFNKIRNGIDLLATKLSNRKHCLLLGGGEPASHPDIEAIVQYFGKKRIMLSMITNGTYSPELYIRLLEYIREYTFSIHFETEHWQKTLSSILMVKKAIELSGLKAWNINVHVIMAPGHFEIAKKAVSILEDHQVSFVYRRVRANQNQGYKEVVYSPEELQFLELNLFSFKNNMYEYWEGEDGTIYKLESNVNDLLIRELYHFKRWKCWAGINRLQIYPDGEMYRSTCLVGGRIGNIFDDFQFPESPIGCMNPRCTCSWALNLTKVREDKYFALFGFV